MNWVLAVDLGNGGPKVAAVSAADSESGRILATAFTPVSVHHGLDGTATQDALEWIDRQFEMRKGFFGIRLNVAVYDPALEDKKYDPRVQRRRREEEEKRLREQGFRLPRVADERTN